jgi:hypothetical protein
LEKLYLSLKKLKLKSSDTSEYYTLSHKLGIVPLGLNKLQNKLFGVECNYEELNGIDYKKGCFVGQENTARIKHKNKLSKRLFSLELINGSVKENEVINFEGKEIGKILIDGNYPFGLIKFRELNLATANLITESGSLKINKPSWINF